MIITSLAVLLSAVSVPAFGYGNATISAYDGTDLNIIGDYSDDNALVYEISHQKYNAEDLNDGVTLLKLPSTSSEIMITGLYSSTLDVYQIKFGVSSALNTTPVNVSGYIDFSFTYEELGTDFDARYFVPFNLMDINDRNIFTMNKPYAFRQAMGDELDYKIVLWLESESTYNVYTGLDSYNSGYSSGFVQGYNEGEAEGSADGFTRGYNQGYDVGYNTGVTESNDYSFGSLFGAIADTPVLMIRNLFNFDFFGVNLLTVVLSLFTGVIIFYLLRKLL